MSWNPKYKLGDKVFLQNIEHALYVVSLHASSGSESIFILYDLAKNMPAPYHYAEGEIRSIEESAIMNETQFNEMKVKEAKEMLKKYGGK